MPTESHLQKIRNWYIMSKTDIHIMQKNSAEETYAIEVDTVTGEYFVRIPEWIVNDQGWFEDTELKFKTDKSLIFIEEA